MDAALLAGGAVELLLAAGFRASQSENTA